jgi:hypothetical protein
VRWPECDALRHESQNERGDAVGDAGRAGNRVLRLILVPKWTRDPIPGKRKVRYVSAASDLPHLLGNIEKAKSKKIFLTRRWQADDQQKFYACIGMHNAILVGYGLR